MKSRFSFRFAGGAPGRRLLLSAALFCVMSAVACTDPLVDERYGQLDEESINGLDAFMELLQEEVVNQRGGEILRASSLTRRVRSEADLMIYFERDFLPEYEEEEYYRKLEAYLFGYDPEDLESVEAVLPDAGIDGSPGDSTDPEFELDQESEPVEIRLESRETRSGESLANAENARRILAAPPRFALQEDAVGDEGGEAPAGSEESFEDIFEQSLEDSLEDSFDTAPASGDGAESDETIDRYKTILYFLKDTDASVAFWRQLTDQMREHPKQRAYCEEQLKTALLARSLDTVSYSAPLSTRRMIHEGGRLVENLRWNRAAFPETEFPEGGLRYPVRTVPGDAFSLFGLAHGEELKTRSLLATVDGGHDLIRELELPFARLIVVYNTESFLNHSQVHPGNRRLARALLRYGLADAIAAGNEAPVAAVVRKIAKTETAAREEFDMLRFLKVFPLNVIVIHSFVLLLLFLYSRWPHTGPPLENQGSGNREFLEHIRALGARLSRTTPRMKALEPLLRYKQKTTGRDYTAIIEKLDEASAGKSSPENPQTPRDDAGHQNRNRA